MHIFNSKKKRQFKLVGASLPNGIVTYLTTYTLAKGCTKTKVIKLLIENWVNSHQKSEPLDALIREITTSLKIQWKVEKAANINLTILDFRTGIKVTLQRKDIPNDIIEQILKGFA